jgi:uncharacterized protein YegL
MGRHPRLEEVVEVADNPEPRCPCVLLLDTSGSMEGERLAALTGGLHTLRAGLANDPIAASRVELAIITFDTHVRLVQPFVAPDRFVPPSLMATGTTHMAEGIERALTLVSSRKGFYKRQGLPYYRPWIFMITDGKPEGEPEAAVAHAAARLRSHEQAKRVAFFAVGVAAADLVALRRIVVREPLPLRGLAFDELFVWLSASMQAVSRSQPGEKVELPPKGWLGQMANFVRQNRELIENATAIGRVVLKATLGAP